jgi:carbamoyltransferase
MYTLGLNFSHDYSACLLKGANVRVALALERLVRVRRGIVAPQRLNRGLHELIEYCLDVEGITLDDVDHVIACSTETRSAEEEQHLLDGVLLLPRRKVLAMPHPGHHLAHACASFFSSGFPEAAALVVDAYGSIVGDGREAESGFAFSRQGLPHLVFGNRKQGTRVAAHLRGERFVMPDRLEGVGEMYRVLSLALGFRQPGTYYDEAGKTMGLASYGQLLSREPVLIRITDHGFDFSNAYPFLASLNLISEESGVRYLNVRPSSTPISRLHRDLAAQLQWEVEEACVHLARRLRRDTGLDFLVLGGGTFLNSTTNFRILKESGFRDIYVFPASTDDGTAVGAAFYGYYLDGGHRFEPRRCAHVFFGRTYASDQVEGALRDHGVPYSTSSTPAQAAKSAAQALAAGRIVGWFQGGSEFGPRSLGNRSVLANALVPGMKDYLNERVKFRESFRPFAPAVLEEQAEEYFDLGGASSPYMLLICPVREKYRDLLASVTHVDGTARVQTVARAANPLFYLLIEEFWRLTGVPVVLNTSFNLRGMPIVETPDDAVRCFLSTEMDRLVMDRFVVEAVDFPAFIPIRNDLTLTASAQWSATASTYALISVAIQQRKDHGDAARMLPISLDQLNLLRLVDGCRSVAAIADEAGIPVQTVVREVLGLIREDLLRWAHVAGSFDAAASQPLVNVGPLPYLES